MLEDDSTCASVRRVRDRRSGLRLTIAALACGCVREETQHKAAGNVLFRQGSVDAALAEYQEAVKLGPRDAEAWILYGNALFEKNDREIGRAHV